MFGLGRESPQTPHDRRCSQNDRHRVALLIDPAGKQPAVDYDSLSRDKTGRVRSQEYGGSHEFFELTKPRHRRA
jgi:hypothetical protein